MRVPLQALPLVIDESINNSQQAFNELFTAMTSEMASSLHANHSGLNVAQPSTLENRKQS
jgi:hypothetical protein